MPLPSTTFPFVVWRQTPAGQAAPGYVLADFAYTILLDGAVQAITPTVTEGATTGFWRAYKFSLTCPATTGILQIFIDPASGYDAIAGGIVTVDLQAYNDTTLAGLILTSQGVPGVRTAESNDLGQVVSGDSYASDTFTVPPGKLTPFGLSDLTGLTLSVEARTAPNTPSSSVALTGTIVSAASRTFTFKWDAMPVGMLLASTDTSATWYIDCQFRETAAPNRIITTNRYFIQVVWDANDTP